MDFPRFLKEVAGLCFPLPLLVACGTSTPLLTSSPTQQQHIHTVFIIMMENHNWTGADATVIRNNPNAPYINNTLVLMGAHAENYYNPPHNHPSLPNYLWLEAGTNFGIHNDGPATLYGQTTTMHLVTLLKDANISWKAYDEGTQGQQCMLVHWHVPFVFFADTTDNFNPDSQYCISHVRPLPELFSDLENNTTARYNFIVPNDCHNMHTPCNGGNQIAEGDQWLSQTVPQILASNAYKNGGVLFIIFDEAQHGDGPIPFIVLSPLAKPGYSNNIHYTHGSTLRTLEEIFEVQPFLRDAANETDLSDLFKQFP
jgi:hypothetical protein